MGVGAGVEPPTDRLSLMSIRFCFCDSPDGETARVAWAKL